jgi:hypothetical protein
MGAKSRGGWNLGMCLKDCTHQGIEEVCNSCLRFSNWNNPNPAVINESKEVRKSVKLGPSMRFHPHYNEAFGKYIGTKGEYLSEMKKGGYEPYTGEAKAPARVQPDTRPTNNVLRAIRDCSNADGSFSPGSNLKSELMRRGVIMSKEAIHKYEKKVKEFQRG